MPGMIPAERRRHILSRARTHGVVSLRDLVDELGVSVSTLRRDLRDLVAEGLLERTRGGAVLPDSLAQEPSYLEKTGEAGAEKEAIAEAALPFVESGDSVLLGPGTTTLALARRLTEVPDLTVVTNSLLVVDALLNAPEIEVVVTGGALRRSIHALVGPGVEQSLGPIGVSTVFLSGNGVSPVRGLTTPNMLVADADRALASAAKRVIVLADYTKVGNETMCQTVPVDAIDVLITDPGADPDVVADLEHAGVRVLVPESTDGDATVARLSQRSSSA